MDRNRVSNSDTNKKTDSRVILCKFMLCSFLSLGGGGGGGGGGEGEGDGGGERGRGRGVRPSCFQALPDLLQYGSRLAKQTTWPCWHSASDWNGFQTGNVSSSTKTEGTKIFLLKKSTSECIFVLFFSFLDESPLGAVIFLVFNFIYILNLQRHVLNRICIKGAQVWDFDVLDFNDFFIMKSI